MNTVTQAGNTRRAKPFDACLDALAWAQSWALAYYDAWDRTGIHFVQTTAYHENRDMNFKVHALIHNGIGIDSLLEECAKQMQRPWVHAELWGSSGEVRLTVPNRIALKPLVAPLLVAAVPREKANVDTALVWDDRRTREWRFTFYDTNLWNGWYQSATTNELYQKLLHGYRPR